MKPVKHKVFCIDHGMGADLPFSDHGDFIPANAYICRLNALVNHIDNVSVYNCDIIFIIRLIIRHIGHAQPLFTALRSF
jgi:hypothetical protein